MALDCLVFDCDGIILESVNVKNAAFAAVCDAIAPQCTERFTAHITLHGGISRFEKFAWLVQEAFGRAITQDEARTFSGMFAHHCMEAVRAAPLVPGFLATVERWHGEVPLFVASGTPHYELVAIMEERGLARYFTGIYGTPPEKAATLPAIVRSVNARPRCTVMVGDSKTDRDAALIAGTLFYGRGEFFRNAPIPWGEDLTGLNEFLETLAAE